MSERPTTFEMLSAYVDGELDAADAAEVARAVAQDPALAREVAALSRLRSAVAEGIDTPDLPLPVPPPASARGTAVAASVALALFVAGAVLMAGFDRDLSAQWLARAWQVHDAWSIDAPPADARPALLLARFADAVEGAYVPDLTASKLSLVHMAAAPLADGQDALLAGYRGTRGCKISLLVFPSAATLGEGLKPLSRGGNEGYAWRAGALGYVLLSDGMDSDRFGLLAESVHAASLRHVPFDERTQIALRRSRDASAPCVA